MKMSTSEAMSDNEEEATEGVQEKQIDNPV